MQGCLWNSDLETCRKKPIEIIDNDDINFEDWDRLGLTNKNVSREEAVKLILKERTISNTKRQRAKTTKGRKGISSKEYLELANHFSNST